MCCVSSEIQTRFFSFSHVCIVVTTLGLIKNNNNELQSHAQCMRSFVVVSSYIGQCNLYLVILPLFIRNKIFSKFFFHQLNALDSRFCKNLQFTPTQINWSHFVFILQFLVAQRTSGGNKMIDDKHHVTVVLSITKTLVHRTMSTAQLLRVRHVTMTWHQSKWTNF